MQDKCGIIHKYNLISIIGGSVRAFCYKRTIRLENGS